jgi:serine/threonine protein kinase
VPPRALEPSLSPALNDVIMKALAKDPAHRYQDCEEFLHALREARRTPGRVAAPAPVTGTQYAERTVAKTIAAGTSDVPLPPPARNRLPMIAGGVLALLLVGAGAGYVMMRTSGPVASPAPASSLSTDPSTARESAPATDSVVPAAEGPAARSSPEGPASRGTAKPAVSPKGLPNAPSATRRGAIREALRERIEERRAAAGSETPSAPPPAAGGGLFSASDIPDLMMRADRYAGRGEYKRAIITYEEVLRLDPRNVAAREGLSKARAAAGFKR